jgi:hypothetical protein
MIEMVGPVLTRTLQPFPAPVRTLDAAGVEFIEENGGGPGVHVRKSGKEKPRK